MTALVLCLAAIPVSVLLVARVSARVLKQVSLSGV